MWMIIMYEVCLKNFQPNARYFLLTYVKYIFQRFSTNSIPYKISINYCIINTLSINVYKAFQPGVFSGWEILFKIFPTHVLWLHSFQNKVLKHFTIYSNELTVRNTILQVQYSIKRMKLSNKIIWIHAVSNAIYACCSAENYSDLRIHTYTL